MIPLEVERVQGWLRCVAGRTKNKERRRATSNFDENNLTPRENWMPSPCLLFTASQHERMTDDHDEEQLTRASGFEILLLLLPARRVVAYTVLCFATCFLRGPARACEAFCLKKEPVTLLVLLVLQCYFAFGMPRLCQALPLSIACLALPAVSSRALLL